MSRALYEFMPYGAPDLISGAPARLFRATMSSMAVWMFVFVVLSIAVIARPRSVEREVQVFIPYRELSAPPPLGDIIAPPLIAIARPVVAPAIGIPVPVPDVEAPADQTIASQQEISAATGSETLGGSGQPIVVEAPGPEELPRLGDYVYTDELPVLVVDVKPRYPDLAREAQLEGDVLLRVLVGKDGHVADVHVDVSVPLLDNAAIEAARLWVFTPALSNNRPVAVWITRLLKFRLTTAA